jgi:hypothetical protein
VPPRLSSSNRREKPDFSTATLGENKANVNRLFSPLFRERLFRVSAHSCTFFSDAQTLYLRPSRRKFDSIAKRTSHTLLGIHGPFFAHAVAP